MNDYDLIVIGGGPAGAAASITARRERMSVLVLESAGKQRFRPGETLAPGTVELLGNLFGRDILISLPGVPFDGIVTRDGRGERLHSHGFATPGMHFLRAQLDEALLRAAVQEGATVHHACPASTIEVGPGQIMVKSPRFNVSARMVVDCSGSTRWLSRRLGIAFIPLSHPLEVAYGYTSSLSNEAPLFRTDAIGWHWSADICQGKRVDCRMQFDGTRSNGPRRSNCTWAIASQLASPHFLLAGDAACTVDPAAAHGVLRALVSGHRAAQAAAAWLSGALGDPLLDYCRQLGHWFFTDCSRLDEYYRYNSGLPDPVGYQARRQHFFGGSDDFTGAGNSAVGAAVCKAGLGGGAEAS